MAAPPLRILCVHGVNTTETDKGWEAQWSDIVTGRLQSFQPNLKIGAFEFLAYNDIFQGRPITPAEDLAAFFKLAGSGIWYGIGDLLHGQRGLGEVPHLLRWTAGMVVQWAQDMAVREQTRRRLTAEIRRVDPDVILAHSLGSLVLYDTLRRDQTLADQRSIVTFGSQIGNPFVRSELGGRIESLGQKFWWHLFNPGDKALTHRISLPGGAPFEQVTMNLDAGFLGHDADKYLADDLTAAHVWQPLAAQKADPLANMASVAARGILRSVKAPRGSLKKLEPVHRALLVGINEYPEPGMQLEGCVNDTFLMSAALQDAGIPANGVRVLLDKRATTAAIWDRLEWLLTDARPDDQRVFFYSGHGAQVPNYGVDDEIDHVDECLVPWDFDWSPEHCILDDRFRDLYAQLDYDTNFTAILDCCHSGGMTRGSVRVRGIDPPPDIRHRALRWTAAQEWEPRLRESASARENPKWKRYAGDDGNIRRLGRGVSLRLPDRGRVHKLRREYDHKGPYLPVLLEACKEAESAYEYKDGATPYGAFTYSIVSGLRDALKRAKTGKLPTYQALCEAAGAAIERLGYVQHPQVVGPRDRVEVDRIPWAVRKPSRPSTFPAGAVRPLRKKPARRKRA